jgi:Pyridoxal-dependent decarboxylase conserved domain
MTLYKEFFFDLASPACTELEMVTLDWLGKMLRKPEFTLYRIELYRVVDGNTGLVRENAQETRVHTV